MRIRSSIFLSVVGSVTGFIQQPLRIHRATGAIRWGQISRPFHDPRNVFARLCRVRQRRHAENRPRIMCEASDVTEQGASLCTAAAENVASASLTEDRTIIPSTSVATTSSNPSSSSLLPLFLLNMVTILWGTQHAVIKLILDSDLSPGMTNLARFSLAALLFSPWTPGLQRHPPPLPFTPEEANPGQDNTSDETFDTARARETWQAGAELGVWMFLGFAFQAVGLGLTTASRSAFLLYLNVKLVPFFAYLLEGRRISISTWVSAFLAFLGTILLSSDGTPPNIGDFWSLLAASTSAMFILRLDKYSGRCEASQLNSANLWVTAALCSFWAAWEIATGRVDLPVALENIRDQGPLIAYLAVVTTALTNWLQALGQRSVPAERAAVIFAMDPVYAAGFAYLLLGEKLGVRGLIGATIITVAALWNQKQIRGDNRGDPLEEDDDMLETPLL